MNKKFGSIPLESKEQQWLFEWANDMAALKWPELSMLYAIPNGGSRNKIEAAHLKQQGTKSGVPDICLPVARGGYHGLYIELKRVKGGNASGNQKCWIDDLRRQGYRAEICKGFQKAADLIEEYMNL